MVGGMLSLAACTLPLPPRQAFSEPIVLLPSEAPSKPHIWLLKKHVFESLKTCALEGDVYAQGRLAELYLNGDPSLAIEKNQSEALHWFVKAAQGGLGYAQVQMGHFYRDGSGVEPNSHQALHWYERAAHQGEVTGLLALGDLYRQGGYGVHRDPSKALDAYRQALFLGSFEAEYRMAWLLVQDKPHHARGAFELLQRLADDGDVKALSDLGDLCLEGRVVPRNPQKAKAYYSKAASLGDAEAAFKLGMLYQVGEGVPVNHPMAFRWFMAAAERGFAVAQLQVGHLYRDGYGVDKDYVQAAGWYRKGSEQGLRAATLELADLVHAGKGVKRDLREAARLYTVAAVHQPYAQFMLSILYAQGRGVAPDMVKSVAHYKAATRESGVAMAQYKIAERYREGFALPCNFEEAYRWYALAAEHDLTLAELRLGGLYEAGQGVDQDLSKALMWYYKAAKRGNPEAQYRVGLMFLEGKGVEQNATRAALWVRKAAYQGAKQAQHQLGLLYLKGEGVAQDDVAAYAWLSIALVHQSVTIPTVLQDLINNMDPDARQRAVDLAETLQARYQSRAYS